MPGNDEGEALYRRRFDRPPGAMAGGRELIAVAVAPVDGDPVVRHRFVESALKIPVAHGEKIIARQHAAYRDAVAHENTENLAADVFVGGGVVHRNRHSQVVFNCVTPMRGRCRAAQRNSKSYTCLFRGQVPATTLFRNTPIPLISISTVSPGLSSCLMAGRDFRCEDGASRLLPGHDKIKITASRRRRSHR